MNRETVYALLRMATGTKNNNELMDALQDIGAVSSNAVTIEDVANSDLTKALNHINK